MSRRLVRVREHARRLQKGLAQVKAHKRTIAYGAAGALVGGAIGYKINRGLLKRAIRRRYGVTNVKVLGGWLGKTIKWTGMRGTEKVGGVEKLATYAKIFTLPTLAKKK